MQAKTQGISLILEFDRDIRHRHLINYFLIPILCFNLAFNQIIPVLVACVYSVNTFPVFEFSIN